jgi:hypothetical protein
MLVYGRGVSGHVSALRHGVEDYQRALAECHPGDIEMISACMAMRCLAGAGVARIQGGIDENVCCV